MTQEEIREGALFALFFGGLGLVFIFFSVRTIVKKNNPFAKDSPILGKLSPMGLGIYFGFVGVLLMFVTVIIGLVVLGVLVP